MNTQTVIYCQAINFSIVGCLRVNPLSLGLVWIPPGQLRGLRELTRAHGALNARPKQDTPVSTPPLRRHRRDLSAPTTPGPRVATERCGACHRRAHPGSADSAGAIAAR